jgi:hypothetical protein
VIESAHGRRHVLPLDSITRGRLEVELRERSERR